MTRSPRMGELIGGSVPGDDAHVRVRVTDGVGPAGREECGNGGRA
ncbi:MAG: hypothetical protein Q8P61_07125 [Candidatus Nanopelagicales bacterium]|nr:hypothetical protein [Candidatus Nanopelagicales bacterium]